MTPLTHAVVGTVIYQQLRRPWAGRVGWVLAFPLAFVSHYLLDAIPHFEGVGPWLRYRDSVWVFAGFGLIGAGLSVYLYRRNRQAGLLWLTLCAWVGLSGITEPLLRPLRAILPPIRLGGVGLDLSPLVLMLGLSLLAGGIC